MIIIIIIIIIIIKAGLTCGLQPKDHMIRGAPSSKKCFNIIDKGANIPNERHPNSISPHTS